MEVQQPRHRDLRESWLADLWRGDQGDRHLERGRRFRYIAGLVKAGVRIRLADTVAPLGGYLDHVLSSEKRTCKVIATLVIGSVAYLLGQEGLMGVVTNGENLAAMGAGLYGAALVLRHVRGIKTTKSPKDRDGVN